MSHPLGDCYGTNHRRVPRAKGVFFVEYVADGVGWGGFVLCEACWKIYDRSAKVRLTAESREEIEEWFGSSPYAECRMCAELVEIGPEEDEVTQEWWNPEEDPIADLADDPELQALVESALAKARAVALEMEDRDRVSRSHQFDLPLQRAQASQLHGGEVVLPM